jgi:hypothetical protein
MLLYIIIGGDIFIKRALEKRKIQHGLAVL